jgi:hypothetical protein
VDILVAFLESIGHEEHTERFQDCINQDAVEKASEKIVSWSGLEGGQDYAVLLPLLLARQKVGAEAIDVVNPLSERRNL